MQFIKAFSGDTEIIKWMDEPDNLVHFAHELSFTGFHIEMLGARFPYLLKGGMMGSEVWSPVRGGDYYVSFQFLATEGEDKKPWRFQVYVDSEQVGEFTLDKFDGRYYLFCSEKPISLMGHRRIYLKVLEGEDITVSCVTFSKTPVFPVPNEIINLTSDNGQIRFVTTKPSVCRLECGGNVLKHEEYLRCHAFDVDAKAGERFLVCAVEEAGHAIHKEGIVTISKMDAVYPTCEYRKRLFYDKHGADRMPVTAFWGFAKGECFDIKDAGICDDYGMVYPADCTITSHWDDGSIKSVSIAAVLIPDGRDYYFISRAALKDTDVFEIRKQNGKMQVVNGKEKYDLSENSAYLIPGICSKTVLYIDGKRSEAMPGCWKVKKEGKAVIVLERKAVFSAPASEQQLYMEISFFRGIPGYRLNIGLENMQLYPRLFSVDAWYLELYDIGVAGEKSVYQVDDNWLSVDDKLTHGRYEGSIDLGRFGIHVADFWQNYPKSIECKGEKTVIGLMPFMKHREIYEEYSKEERLKLLYYINDDKYHMHVGMRKLQQIGFADSKMGARLLTERIFMRPECEVLEKSEAFGPILTCNEKTGQFDATMERGYELLMALREKKREYGMFNYGDWHDERYVNWGNCEYDLPYAGLVQFLRGAGEKYAKLGLLAAEHMEQIDHIRVHATKALRGLFFLHTIGHSNYYEGKDDTVWDEYFAHMGHLFVQGLTEWYKVTADTRFRDAVLKCADNLCGEYCTHFDFITEREPAWVMFVMLAAYELSLDKKYVNACRIIVERVSRKQDPKTGAIKAMVSFGESERKIVFGGKPFMCGILMSALQRYHDCVQDEDSFKVLEKIAHWLAHDMWDDEAKGFWYTTYAKMRKTHCYQANNMEIIEGLLFAYTKNGDPILYERAKEAFDCAMNLEYREFDVGKTFAMRLRFSPGILKMLYGIEM